MNVELFYPILLESSGVCIDSREVVEGSVFFAFTGSSFNAAQNARQAIDRGAIAVIVEDAAFAAPQDKIFLVDSTLVFLQQLARFHRKHLNIPVIGLTGSNGKTTSKELIHAVLSQHFRTQYTKGNFNNHIGVPLSLLSVRAEHQIAVIEMGANHQGEIAFLCEIARPTFGYITNFGKAHLEGFGGLEGVIKGKSELYDYLKSEGATALVNQEDTLQVAKMEGYQPAIRFGVHSGQYLFTPLEEDRYIGISFEGQKAISNLTGAYNFSNLSAAVALGLHFGVPLQKIKEGIEQYVPSNMRSQVVTKDHHTLVLDTYNANPSSMKEALANFSQFQGSKCAVLGAMKELGEYSMQEHADIYGLAQKSGLERIITVGVEFAQVGAQNENYSDVYELIEGLNRNPIKEQNILIKGSRGTALEKCLENL